MRRTLANDVVLDMADGMGGTYHDLAGRITRYEHLSTGLSGSPRVAGFEYEYDHAGNPLMKRDLNDPAATQLYKYDSLRD